MFCCWAWCSDLILFYTMLLAFLMVDVRRTVYIFSMFGVL